MYKKIAILTLAALICSTGNAMAPQSTEKAGTPLSSLSLESLSEKTMIGTTDTPHSLLTVTSSREETPYNHSRAIIAEQIHTMLAPKQDIAIQAESDFTSVPTINPIKRYFSRGARYTMLATLTGSAVGALAALGTQAICNRVLPDTLSNSTRKLITLSASQASRIGCSMYTAYALMNHWDKTLVPGNIAANAVLQEETTTELENGTTKTVRYWTVPTTSLNDYDSDDESEEDAA